MELGKIRLLILNDVYSVEPVNGIGGYAEVSTLISQYRTENSLFFLNGDFLGGSAFAQHSEGQSIIEILNAMKLDCCVIGNHEFDYGPEVLCKRIGEANFPCLGANIKSKITHKILENSKEYEIYKFKFQHPITQKEREVSLGVFGICTLYTPNLSFPGPNVLFEPIVPKTKEMISILKPMCDIVVAQTHVSLKEDLEIANSSKGIDVIIGGHDHKPFAQTENDILIFKCGQNAYWLGIIDLALEIDDETDSVKCFPSWKMILNRKMNPDIAVSEIIRKYKLMKENEDKLINMDEVIATVRNGDLISLSDTVRGKPSQFANHIADAMLNTHFYLGNKADFAIVNGGVIRGDKVYPEGTALTRRIILEELPFPLKTTMIEIDGKSIKHALEQHLIAVPNSSGSYPHVSSNVRLEYKASNLFPHRIISLRIDGAEIDLEKKYRLVTTTFLAGGGDNISAYKEGSVTLGDAQKWIDGVLSYFKFLGDLDAALDVRVLSVK